MSFFNWFSAKSSSSTDATDKDTGPAVRDNRGRPRLSRDKPTPLPMARVDHGNRSEERKVQRHARREQLYQAVREASNHSGVLSASYRFKVLSLDQAGNEFLVMMDVDQSFDHRAEKLAEIETRIVQIAKTRYEIRVTSVYWRISTSGVARNINVAAQDVIQTAAVHDAKPASPAASKGPNFRYEPIQDEEVAAFKQALQAASANSHVLLDTASKPHGSPRSYTLLTGFEDTEMSESGRTPVLSVTQYGDLN